MNYEQLQSVATMKSKLYQATRNIDLKILKGGVMPKTSLRKSINKELESKLLLQDASLFQIIKSLYRKHTSEVWCFVCALGIGLAIGAIL